MMKNSHKQKKLRWYEVFFWWMKYFFLVLWIGFFVHFLLLALSIAMTKSNTSVIRKYEYSSDGCSMFIDGDYRECCEVHDRAYWEGGRLYKKLVADALLYACIAEKGHNVRENFMFPAVLIGWNPGFPTRFRWGYGYPYPYYDIREGNN
jgi:hypothetical protein